MTHDELLALIKENEEFYDDGINRTPSWSALRAVVELHKPSLRIEPTSIKICDGCQTVMLWERCATIQAIEKELM